MNRILQMGEDFVTVQAGTRLRDLARALADADRELVGSYEEPDRTVGGTVFSGALSAGPASDGPHLAATVTGIGLVMPDGRQVDVDAGEPGRLLLLRQSYGVLGIAHSVTLKTRAIRPYGLRHRKINYAQLPEMLDELVKTPAGVKLYLLPFRDCAFIELREPEQQGIRLRAMNWRIGDWLAHRALPSLSHSCARSFSIGRIRDPLIDGFSEATQMIVQSRFVDAGSNAMEQTSRFRRVGASSRIRSCTWTFPARRFAGVLYSYREFCRRHYDLTGFRCDLPALGYRLLQDPTALLSPSFDAPMFALSLRSTMDAGWEDFLVDFASIADTFGGRPVFNLSRHFTAAQTAAAYGKRLTSFADVRRRADPGNRLLNQFFSEYVA